MKLVQANRDDLLKPLHAVSGIVEKRHTLPILSNVLLERTGDKLHLLATDLEIQVSTSFAVSQKNNESYVTSVSARKLQEILRALPDGVEVSLETQNDKLQIKSAKSRFTLQTLPGADFPKIASGTGTATTITLQQKALRNLLLLVQYAMAQQDIRYYLNGMLLVIEAGTLKAVATDGHRLAYATLDLPTDTKNQEVILPRKAIQELVKLLGDTEDILTLEVTANQARFQIGPVELVTKVVDGKFPDYGRVIPTGYKKQFEIPRIVLQQALQRVAILSNEKFRGVRWTLTDGQLRIACTNTEQEEAFEELQVSYKGEALDIGFNVTYLLDALANLASENVVCSFGDANSSVLITVPDDKAFRYVVMPMRI
jgi:DNA polymerase-3 subunit beta